MVYPARSVSADPLVFAVGAVHVISTLLSVPAGVDVDVVAAGAGLDDVVVDVLVLDMESGATAPGALVAAASEALVALESLHPASRLEASSNEQTIHDPLAPITRPS
jgi:hypothetical protein